jgi:hemerythrin superfamily protein
MASQKRVTKGKSVDILQLLKEQHAEVDELFEKLESGKGDRRKLFIELADKLAAHAGAEEQVFYPNVMSEETAELLRESVEEHLSVKRTLADLLDLDPSNEADKDTFDAKLSVLKESVSHHAHEEEEGKLFPLLRKQMDKAELEELVSEYLGVFETLMQNDPRLQVPAQTAEAAPLPPPN